MKDVAETMARSWKAKNEIPVATTHDALIAKKCCDVHSKWMSEESSPLTTQMVTAGTMERVLL